MAITFDKASFKTCVYTVVSKGRELLLRDIFQRMVKAIEIFNNAIDDSVSVFTALILVDMCSPLLLKEKGWM
jgi:hypothetical protein